MDKIGIVINNLRANQLAYYTISNLNKYYTNNYQKNYTIFYENLQQPSVSPNFALMRLDSAYNFPGDIIVTSFSSALKFKDIPVLGKKYFYIWDTQWFRNIYHFKMLEETYGNLDFELITRCSRHADLVSSCFNRPVKWTSKDEEFPIFLRHNK